ncbi:hypothetical protein [Thiothrix eikelboomii]|uniref:HVO_A0114 family putative DNA-binding protein n=1 Tax=Thiothrix eikelboomii TaxID=92487 RepID=UPI003BB1546A
MKPFAKVFTPKRWELISELKKFGAVSIYELAKRLDRHYRNVHQDVALLSEWRVIEKTNTVRSSCLGMSLMCGCRLLPDEGDQPCLPQ